ncbi:MAG: hypothetical protein WCO82_00305 [Sphingomonadales bacterium]
MMHIESSFNNPRLQPPPMTKKFIMAAFHSLAARHDFFDPAKAAWLVPLIQKNDAANQGFDKMVRAALCEDPDALDRMFRRPLRCKKPAPAYDLPKLLADYAVEDGMINAADADYMVPIMARALAGEDYFERLASQIKTAPPLLEAAKKRAAGINPRLKIGAPFAACLTAAGKLRASDVASDLADRVADLIEPDDPDDEKLLSVIMAEPTRVRRRRADLWRSVESDSPVRFSAVMDRRACQAACDAHGQFFEPTDAPLLPLQACTSLECLCMLSPIPRGIARSQYGYPNWPEPAAKDPVSEPAPSVPKPPPGTSAQAVVLITGLLTLLLLLALAAR